MPNPYKDAVLNELRARFGSLRKLPGSNSLYAIGDDAARVYMRYSKAHAKRRKFFGLRDSDLRQLQGSNSHICFLSNEDAKPVVTPYADFEQVLHRAHLAGDGQYKVQILQGSGTHELYVPGQGRFNIGGYIGLEGLAESLSGCTAAPAAELGHSQVQTLLADIGHRKGFDIYAPPEDIGGFDWTLAAPFRLRTQVPAGYDCVRSILSGVDIIWIGASRDCIEAMFEVEHSTPIYSGLLRFNDVLLTDPKLCRFFIVSNDTRRELFARQIARPTFCRSRLNELTSFLHYANVYEWHRRLNTGLQDNEQS